MSEGEEENMALVREARACLCSVLLGLSVLLIPLVSSFNENIALLLLYYWRYILIVDIALVNGVIWFLYEGHTYQVALRSCLLGMAMGIGLILTFSESTLSLFGWYLTMLAFFHWSEYFVTALVNSDNVTLESFLLDHSVEYHLAAVASVIEFVVEWYFFPGFKRESWVSVIGMALVLGGEALRKSAMIEAGTNFNHYVQHVKHDSHRLVTSGVYRLCRHPSYVGWFYWSIGTQVMLCNPVCIVGYAVASWRFFRFRVEHEEITLLNFFGEEYIDYQKMVGTGLPFIEGCKMQL